ncbi:hypothetical protein [Devosia sp.]|uniref:hypothetical protein n=1 Tax=Devosia sp. TaxID=1871048 RepID=UPI003F71A36B
MEAKTIDALELDGGDALDLIRSLEEDLGISLSPDGSWTADTMGELHAVLVDRVSREAAPGGKCASQMAFYRLRRALSADSAAPISSIRPSTPIEPFCRGNLRSLFGRLEQQTGLSMPRLDSDRFGDLAAMAFALSILTTVIAVAFQSIFPVGFIAMSLLAVAIVGDSLNKGRLRGDQRTVGELARRMAGSNPVPLQRAGARLDRDLIWEVLVARATVFRGWGEDVVAPETRLFERSKQKRGQAA